MTTASLGVFVLLRCLAAGSICNSTEQGACICAKSCLPIAKRAWPPLRCPSCAAAAGLPLPVSFCPWVTTATPPRLLPPPVQPRHRCRWILWAAGIGASGTRAIRAVVQRISPHRPAATRSPGCRFLHRPVGRSVDTVICRILSWLLGETWMLWQADCCSLCVATCCFQLVNPSSQ